MTKDEIHKTILAEIQQERDAITKVDAPLNELIEGLTVLKEQSGGAFDFSVDAKGTSGVAVITTSIGKEERRPLSIWLYSTGDVQFVRVVPEGKPYNCNDAEGMTALLRQITKRAMDCGQIPVKPANQSKWPHVTQNNAGY